MAMLAGILAFVLAVGALYQKIGARRSARRCEAPGELVEIGGQRLHTVRAGSGGPPVLFEAGVGASSLSWTRVMPAVAAFAQACAYDRAGLGWSDRGRAARTVDRIVADLHGVLAHAAGPGPVVLAGHSFGAFLVLVYRHWIHLDEPELVVTTIREIVARVTSAGKRGGGRRSS